MMKMPVHMACLLAACATTAGAQTVAAPPRADPLQAQATVPPAATPATFATYRRHGSVEVQPGSWRAANDNVNRIGGWRTYAREAQASGPATGAPAAGTAGPAASTAGPTQQPTPAVSGPATGPAPSAPAHRH